MPYCPKCTSRKPVRPRGSGPGGVLQWVCKRCGKTTVHPRKGAKRK